MREKKFRAWDAEREEFIYSHIPSDDYYFVIEGNHVVAYVRHGETEGVSFPYEPPEPIWDKIEEVDQYTGFKDCNGVEIYEAGDVVKDSEGAVFAVEWDNLAGAWIACLPKIELLGAFNPRNIEVIGTIHENPELREEKRQWHCESEK